MDPTGGKSSGSRGEELFRQFTPLVLLGIIAVAVFERWVPGAAWVRENLGDTALLRGCVAALGLYTLLLWGESLRLHGILTGVLRAFREYQNGGVDGKGRPSKARVEAARLLLAAMRSEDPQIRTTSHRNLVQLAGRDLGTDPAAWAGWLAEIDPL